MKTGTDRVEPELGLRRLDCVPEVLWQSRFSGQNLLVLQPVQRAAPVHFGMGEGFDPEPGIGEGSERGRRDGPGGGVPLTGRKHAVPLGREDRLYDLALVYQGGPDLHTRGDGPEPRGPIVTGGQ